MLSSQDFCKSFACTADRNLVASVANQGLRIGHCLQDALRSLQQDNTIDDEEYSDEEVSSLSRSKLGGKRPIGEIQLSQSANDRILQTFGEAVADSPWTKTSKVATTPDAARTHRDVMTIPPPLLLQGKPPDALLSGRLDHYNRFGKNWSIVVDKVRIQPRIPVHHLLDRPSKSGRRRRRRKRRENLWEMHSQVQKREIPIRGTLQILAYDDL